MNKFDKLYNIILEENGLLNAVNPYIGLWIAPQKPFKITKENYVSGACYADDYDNTWAGIIRDVLSDNIVLVEVKGNYSERMVPDLNDLETLKMRGYSAFRRSKHNNKIKINS